MFEIQQAFDLIEGVGHSATDPAAIAQKLHLATVLFKIDDEAASDSLRTQSEAND